MFILDTSQLQESGRYSDFRKRLSLLRKPTIDSCLLLDEFVKLKAKTGLH